MTAPDTTHRDQLAAIIRTAGSVVRGWDRVSASRELAGAIIAAGWAPTTDSGESREALAQRLLNVMLDCGHQPNSGELALALADTALHDVRRYPFAAPTPPTGDYFVCRHCGTAGKSGEDHTCSCPHPDETCPDHPQGFRAAPTDVLGRAVAALWPPDRKSTRLNSSHPSKSRMPSSA